MKIGIIGPGSIARVHAKALRAIEGIELRAFLGRRPGAADALAGEFGATAFSDIDAFLAEVDAVTIATPSGAHLEPALAALRVGRHVICEKPLEVTTARIDRMIAMAREHGAVLAPILNRRFTPAIEAFKAAVDAGRLGRVTSASCYVKWFRDQAYYDSAPWRGTWALDGGGALMNQSIHAIDALLHLAGPVRRVQASTACLAHEGIETEDIGVALLEFESGARGVIEGSTCCWSRDGHPVRLQLAGTAGSIFLADECFEAWEFRDARPEDELIRTTLMARGSGGLGANDPGGLGIDQHRRNFEEALAAIREGRDPSPSAADARASVALLEAIYASARQGGTLLSP